MGLIALENMEFFACHGVYPEEQILGNKFIVDIYITTSLEDATLTDEVNDTINYETVFLLIQVEMKKKVQLIETLNHNIINELKRQFNNIEEVKVRVRKHRPIPGHLVGSSYVEEEDSFVSECPRCGSPFVCYNDETCWCYQKRVTPETREILKTKYSGCLCNECLSFYAG